MEPTSAQNKENLVNRAANGKAAALSKPAREFSPASNKLSSVPVNAQLSGTFGFAIEH